MGSSETSAALLASHDSWTERGADGWTDGWINGADIDGWIDRWMDEGVAVVV